MEQPVVKGRTPSRCREWERNRRNKFNDAVSRLGDLVREIMKAIDSTHKNTENIQYPKIEIIEKAIICLKNFTQEKTQMKAEILALQVKLQTIEKSHTEKKDASTQVFIGINKKKSNGKYVKVLMLKKSKGNLVKEKVLPKNSSENKDSSILGVKNIAPAPKPPPKKLPILLPNTNLNNKKSPENTIVVLPATPYILPQRPFLLPAMPPTFVLVDQNLNKAFPVMNRTNADTTKTTTVNILPISAYSRPHSAKAKKVNSKPKNKNKKPSTKLNQNDEVSKKITTEKNNSTTDNISNTQIDSEKNSNNKENLGSNEKIECKKGSNNLTCKTTLDQSVESVTETSKTTISNPKSDTSNQTQGKPHMDIDENIKSKKDITLHQNKQPDNVTNSSNLNKENKDTPVKNSLIENKDKVNNILESSICDNTADVGNARLELAEEFLATSPTAAFLMSFPLVSGNRADSPVEESQSNIHIPPKDNDQRRNDASQQNNIYLEKPTDNKLKSSVKPNNFVSSKDSSTKSSNSATTKSSDINKNVSAPPTSNTFNDNPFLNLSMPSVISSSCTLTDPTYGLDFDCNVNKCVTSQSTNYASGNNIFYKNDALNPVKNNIYSTSSIPTSHDYNSFGLYPCAMDKYATKNKGDYSNVEDNIAKIGSSRLTYDIDLGWSHKSLDFVASTHAVTSSKDTIFTSTAGQYSSTYNPFNPEFHVSLTPSTNKRDALGKTSTSFVDSLTSFYSQPTNLWTDDVPFYSNNSITKTSKQQCYLPLDHSHTTLKTHNTNKPAETLDVIKSSSITTNNINIPSDKHTKKSPNKMHINWMTSEIRPIQYNCNPPVSNFKENKTSYGQIEQQSKKQDHSEMNNYFPLTVHNIVPQAPQEEVLSWQPARGTGTTEISIEPPPLNLPTLVGDLALGPHDKKKTAEHSNKYMTQTDYQNCSNFFSVTQLMNRSAENIMPSRYQGSNTDVSKMNQLKQYFTNSNENNRKQITRIENQLQQPYMFNESKPVNSADSNSFATQKLKTTKSDKTSKSQKNSYSAEALIRGGTCAQKIQDNNRFMSSQKYTDLNLPQDSIAQVSHFPPIIDYSDNNYHGQTTLYNSTANSMSSMSNSFYSNLVPGSGNLISSNYGSGHFTGEFIDYSQTTDCNYSTIEKASSNYKNSRRESTKHKLECSKKEPNKKYQSKRAKLADAAEEWHDTSNLLWQNRTPSKKLSNLPDENSFTNYVGNQISSQYQPDFFNSHLMHPNIQAGTHNVDRSFSSFPATSRANFNLSTIFPEITMKVQ